MSESVCFVVDASVAIKLFIDQEGADKAKALFLKLSGESETQLHVPGLFYVECANVLWQYVQRTDYSAKAARASLSKLRKLDLHITSISALAESALELAVEQNISAYDACYVELSTRLGCELITADQKLVRALESTDYQVCALLDT